MLNTPKMNLSLADRFASLPDDCIGLVLGYCDIVKDFRLTELLPAECDKNKTIEQWKKNGQIVKKTDVFKYTTRHNATNTAFVTKQSMTNVKTRTTSFHSIDDTPAVMHTLENGVVVLEEYYVAGKYYRRNTDLPVSIKRSLKGIIIKEKYLINCSEEFMTRGPKASDKIQLMVKTFNLTGELSMIEYYLNDKYHRINGPAVVHYENSAITRIIYYEYGVRHRSSGSIKLYMEERLTAYKSWFDNQKNKRKPSSKRKVVAKKLRTEKVPMEVDGEEEEIKTVDDVYPDFGYDLEYIIVDEKYNADLPSAIYFLEGRPIKLQFHKEGFLFRSNLEKPAEIEFENGIKISEKFVTAYHSNKVFSKTQTFTIEYSNGQKIREIHRMGDTKYAPNDETPIEVRYKNGIIVYKEFKCNKDFQSKPVVYEYYETGELKTEIYTDPDYPCYYDNSQPFMIHYYKNGNRKQVIYQVRGHLHRDGAPALINCYESGVVQRTVYYYRGNIHNDKAPAYQEWRPDGTRLKCAYFFHGELIQRPDKVSHIRYDETGTCVEKCSYSNGSVHVYKPKNTTPVSFAYDHDIQIDIRELLKEFPTAYISFTTRPGFFR